MAPAYQGSGAETETENQGAPRQDQEYFRSGSGARPGPGPSLLSWPRTTAQPAIENNDLEDIKIVNLTNRKLNSSEISLNY